jgi:hypothetical protein
MSLYHRPTLQDRLEPMFVFVTRAFAAIGLVALLAIILLVAQDSRARADTRQRTCEGTLVKNGGWLTDGIPPDFDGICQLSLADRAAVLRVCGYGPCEVSGTVTDCPVECVKFIHIASIRSKDAKESSE